MPVKISVQEHHTTLCNSKVQPSEHTRDKAADNKQLSTDVAGFLTPISPYMTPRPVTTCLLKTAIIPVIAGNNKTKANILFDEEVQCSFKSTGKVKELPTSTTDILVASFGSTSRSWSCNGNYYRRMNFYTSANCTINCCIYPECCPYTYLC